MKKEYDEELILALEYLKKHNKTLYNTVMNRVTGKDTRKEIWLEFALYIGLKKGFEELSHRLIDMYEEESMEQGNSLPFLVWATRESLMRSQFIHRESNYSHKRLYVFKMENNTVKIGIATEIKRRMAQVQSSSGMRIKNYAYTGIFDNAIVEEKRLHKKYKENREKGEYFSIPYDVALKELKDIAELQKADIAIDTV